MAEARIKAVITAEDRASSVVQGFGSSVGNMAKAVAIGELAVKGITAAMDGFKAAGKSAIDSAADFEQNRIAFETMLGSADKAKKLLKDVSEFAAQTPFQLPDVVKGAKQLLAYNVAAEDILPTFKALGNIAAGVGKDKLPELVLAFGQVKTMGHLAGQELRQFTEAGVPLVAELAKQMHTTEANVTEMVSAGKIGFPQVQKAIFGMTGAGGKFFNLMERQSHTFDGTLSNLSDNFGRFAREIIGINDQGDIRQGSIFAKLQQAAQAFLDWTNSNRATLEAFFQGVADKVAQFGQTLFDYISTHREDVIGFFKSLGEIAVVVGGAIVALTKFVIEHRDVMIPVIGVVLGLVVAYKALQTAMSFIALIQAFTAAIMALGTAVNISGTVGALTSAFGGLAAVLAAPLIISIIGIGAIIAAKQAVDDLNNSYNNAQNAIANADKLEENLIRKIQQNPNLSTPEKNRRIQALSPRAAGGPVSGGVPYMVGERGPELFVPKQSGSIVPNDKISQGSNTTINLSVNVGAYAGSEMEKRRLAEELFRAYSDISGAKGAMA